MRPALWSVATITWGLALWSVKTTPWGPISLGPDRLNRMTKLKYYDKLLIERLRGAYEDHSNGDTRTTL